MIVRKFRPVQEEITGVWFQTAFIIFWYSTILINILRSGFRMDYLIFIVAGLLPVYMVIQCARSAYFYRRERREAIRLGNVRPGRIVNIEGFQFKENKHEPDIIAGTREFEDTSVFPRVVQTVVLLMIILSIVKQYFR